VTARADFDLAVVGAGPAGSAAALAAGRRGLSVALFDPLREPADTPCGEGLMPEGVLALRELGIEFGAGEVFPFRTLRYVVPRGRSFALLLPGEALAIPRPRLAAALARAVRAEPRIERIFERAAVRPIEARAAGFTIEHEDGATHARTLILADGAQGDAVDWLRPTGYASGRFGLRCRFESARPLTGVEVHLTGGCEVYLTPLPGRLVNAAFLFERPLEGARGPEELVGLALDAAPRASSALGTLVTPPRGRRLDRLRARAVARTGAFLAGDAGAAVDPILGCGVTIALRSGVLAAGSCADLLRGAHPGAVERAYARALARESRSRRALAKALRFLAGHPSALGFLARAGSLRPALFEPLVRRAALGGA